MDVAVSVLVKDVLQELNVIAFNETPKTVDQYLVLRKFNMLLDSWRGDSLLVNKLTRQVFDLAAATQSYTIGSGATWNTQRPEEIYRAGLLDVTSNPTDPTEYEVTVLTDEEWASIALKTQGGQTVAIWYEKSMPNGRIYAWPIPDAAYDMVLYTPVPLVDVAESDAGLATVLSLPPGYRRMIVNNLAMESADSFEKPITATLSGKADASMEIVKRRNARPSVLKLPAELTRRAHGFRLTLNQ
jgi:hypothetical protein